VANLAEECWIEFYDTRNPEKGFNLIRGGSHTPHSVKNSWDRPEYREKPQKRPRNVGRIRFIEQMLTLVIAQRFKLLSLKLPIRSLSKTNGKNLIFDSEVFNHKKIDGMTKFYALSLAHVGKTLSLPIYMLCRDSPSQ